MDVDLRPDENTDPQQGQSNEKLEKYKQSLFTKLNEQSVTNLDKCFSQALFIQAMFKQDLNVLIKLFNFYLDKNHLNMSIDLLFNDLFKNFDLNQTNVFDSCLNKFSLLIIKNLGSSNKSFITQKLIDGLEQNDQVYYDLYLKIPYHLQEVLITKILDKYRYSYNKYLKIFIEGDKKSTPVQPAQQQAGLKDFYANFSQTYQNLYLIKDLLVAFKKYAPEYGLYLIDTFLNIEKHMHTYLVQNSQQLKLDTSLISIERRSLNLVRRVCVLDLIQEFANIIDKLDNRHCYRWIEKCLEFFTKYSNCSTQVSIESNMDENVDSLKISYSSVKLLHDSEIVVNDEIESNESLKQEQISQIKANLNDIIDYKYEPLINEPTPYSNVYKLLDEIGRKLEWPIIPDKLKSTEDKMTYLFNLKLKSDKSISVSSLNKQISFYSLTFFFNKLTEFQALSRTLCKDQLILSPLYKLNKSTDTLEITNIDSIEARTVSNFIYCLKTWQKFNLHKEYYTIVTKCLSNSKLDTLNSYKSFLSDYYNIFQLCVQPSQSYNWTNTSNLSPKQKIPIVSYLFMNEKTTFKNFFEEFTKILNELETQSVNSDRPFYAEMCLSKNLVDMFDLNKMNLIKYFSKLITEKLTQLMESKRQAASSLIENDSYISVLLVLLQSNKTEYLYDFLIQVLRSKQSLQYPEFFKNIFDVQMLQDIFVVVNQSGAEAGEKFNLGQKDVNINEKFLNQLNEELNTKTSYEILIEFLMENTNLIIELFDKVLNLSG